MAPPRSSGSVGVTSTVAVDTKVVTSIVVKLPEEDPDIVRCRRLLGDADNQARLLVILLSSVFIALYLTVFSVIFAYSEPDWNGIQAVYFVVVTISTVGYGDISGTQPWTKVLSCIMMITGVVLVFPLMGSGVEYLTKKVTGPGRNFLERTFPRTHIDIDGDGESDYDVPRSARTYYGIYLAPSLLLNAVVQFAFAGWFMVHENWTYAEAMYHCFQTATTVGYGDLTPLAGNSSQVHTRAALILPSI